MEIRNFLRKSIVPTCGHAVDTCVERVSTLPDIPKLNLGSFPNFLGNPQTSAVLLKNEQK